MTRWECSKDEEADNRRGEMLFFPFSPFPSYFPFLQMGKEERRNRGG